MATFDEFYASLDPDVGVRGKQFEKFVKWFLKTDPTWASQVEEIWFWNEYPKRWGADCGIDLIFTHKNGQTWAVQSKCVSPNNDIKKSEIDSFLSESNYSKIDGRLLIASTDGIGKNAQQVINRQEKQVVCFLLEQFRQSKIEFPSSMRELNEGKRQKKKTPDPRHQIEVIEKVSEGLKTAYRGQVLMACGTGKTLTSLWIKEKINARQVLVLVPSLSLLSQTLKEWNAEANQPFKWICVCSDNSVAKDKSEDQLISNTSEIGVPVTSDPLDIKNFLDESGSKVVFATYQSAKLIVEAQEHHDTSMFDLAIADEAHRCAGKVSSAFGSVLDEKKIKASKRLFFTATPRILTSRLKQRAREKEIEVVSMDDESIFGKVLHEIKFSEAIEKKLLSDYQVVVVGVDDEMIRSQIINRDLIEIRSNGLTTDAETLAAHIALTKTIKEYNLNRVITFHGLVKGAKNFAEDHVKVHEWINSSSKLNQAISISHVSGKMNTAKKNKRINKLKNLKEGEVGILTNARCLSEGVDVPTLDGIAFIDPRQSQIDIIQAVGRAIRKSDNKTFGTIILPVYLSDISENVDDQVLATKFANIWKIILALKSQDDSLMEEIDTIRINLGKRGTGKSRETGIKKIIIDLPESISLKFVDRIKTILIQNTSDNWLEIFGKLIKFKKDNDNKFPSSRTPILGKWVGRQRGSFKKKQLSKERIDLLESIGFIWDPLEDEWNTNFHELKEYVKNYDHACPPRSGKYRVLGEWVGRQRIRKESLSKERIDLLESIGFIWDPLDAEWQRDYQILKEYLLNNSFPITNNADINSWVKYQRRRYKQNKLSQKRIKLLEDLKGWVWEHQDQTDEEWQRDYQILKEYLLNNSFPITNNADINSWVKRQRRRFKEDTLSPEKIDLLESLEGWVWDQKEGEWHIKFQILKEYLLNNSFPITNNADINSWVKYQRRRYKQNKLSQKRIKLLEGLKGWVWNQYDADWQVKFKELEQYAAKFGNASPPYKHPSLGMWVSTQRSKYKNEKLSNDQIKLLESLPGWVWEVV